MQISRRAFVGAAACGLGRVRLPATPKCALLHLGCVLPDSYEGFRRTGILTCPSADRDMRECRSYVVPAAGQLTEENVRKIAALDRRGGWIIFESAAGFTGFESQRRMLRNHFGITIGPPVTLSSGRVPYVDFTWPVEMKVRDYSHAVPVRARSGEIIARIGALPVAVRRGRFIFLGSPVGPALFAGDREAGCWFNALQVALA